MNKKDKAMEMYRNGNLKVAIARELGVPHSTVSAWLADRLDKWDIDLSAKWLREPIRRAVA